jgi:hypothetical protein
LVLLSKFLRLAEGDLARSGYTSAGLLRLKRLHLTFPHGLETFAVHREWRAASRARDLVLCFELAKALDDGVVAVRAGNGELRVAQQIDHSEALGKNCWCI